MMLKTFKGTRSAHIAAEARPGLAIGNQGKQFIQQPHRRSRARVVVAVATLAMSVVAGTAQPSVAVPSLAQHDEVVALYRHHLDRAPDGSGLNYYTHLIDTNGCRAGLSKAAFDLATSPEAVNRWQTAENLVGSAYAGELHRAPDPGGFRDNVALTRASGWTTTMKHFIGSLEYRGRLNALCGVESSAAAEISPSEAAGVRDGLLDGAQPLAIACGGQKLLNKVTAMKTNKVNVVPSVSPISIAVGIGARLGARLAGADPCKATTKLLEVAGRTEYWVATNQYSWYQTASWTEQHHPLPGITIKREHLLIWTGSDPSHDIIFTEIVYVTR